MGIMNDDSKSAIPDTTIETLARGFFREASTYGFRRMDYVRFVNILLDAAMATEEQSEGTLDTGPATISKDSSASGSVRLDTLETVHMPLMGEQVKIRAFDPAQDTLVLRKWVSDEFGRYFLLSAATARHEKLDKLINSDSTVLGIITCPDGTPIGVIAYLNYDAWHKKAELRKLIGEPSARGKGLGRAATKLWIEYGKAALSLKKIYLNTLDTNIRNIRLNEELGFKIEGILRNELLIDNTYRDVLRMSLWLT
jgi:RimJ/RimL family protein N-acetyltransferase